MTKIKITTTQNIEIEYELATIFDRILAWLIDSIILVAYVGIASIVVTAAMGEPSMGAISIILVPALLYHLLMELIFQGQSVGKMALRIRVVRVDGSPPNFGNYVLRWIFRLLETNVAIFYGTAAIGAIAFSPRGQRFGDMMAGTTIIRLGRKVSLAETSFGGATRDGYQPTFPEAKKLDDEDARTIREVLLHHRTLQSQGVLTSCANRVCHVLGVTPPNGMGAEQFLRVVLRDYSHTHS
ncbi:MAG: RDD family protein [Bacteroidia bacterium]